MLSPSTTEETSQEIYELIEGAMEFRDNQDTEIPAIDDNEWSSNVNLDEIPSDIDNLLSNYLDVDDSTVERGIAVSSEGDLP